MTVEIKIKEMREEAGITLEDLAEDTGIEKERLEQIENKTIPVDDILFIEMLVIADSLGIEILALFTTSEIEIGKEEAE